MEMNPGPEPQARDTSSPAPASRAPLAALVAWPLAAQGLVLLVTGLGTLAALPQEAASVLAGGAGAFLPSALSGLVVLRAAAAPGQASRFLRLLYTGETLKILATAGLLAAVLASGRFHPLPVLAAFLVCLAAGWTSLALTVMLRSRHGA